MPKYRHILASNPTAPGDEEWWEETENSLGALLSQGLKLWQVPAWEPGCLFQ